MFESIVGSGGVFLHPAHYVLGVRALCDKSVYHQPPENAQINLILVLSF